MQAKGLTDQQALIIKKIKRLNFEMGLHALLDFGSIVAVLILLFRGQILGSLVLIVLFHIAHSLHKSLLKERMLELKLLLDKLV